MNKYQEALQNLYDMRSKLIDVNSKNTQWANNIKIYDFISDQLRTIQELVDKENPMKPKTNKYGRGSEWVCPNCKTHIAYFDDLGIGTVPVIKYCRECGQRLDLGGDRE